MKNLRSFFIRYGTGALSPGVALLAALLLWPVIKPFAMPLFLTAIVISAWQGGKGPGLVATLVSGLIVDYVFITPQYQISGTWDDLGRLAVFGLEGFLLSWLVASRKRVEDEVRKSREDLRALSAHLQSGIEAERTRISREIHDELGQSLTGLKFDVSWLRDQTTEARPESEREKLDATLKNIDTAIQSVRRIATELRPPVLDTLGLTAAIEWQATDFQNRTGIECQINPMAEDIPLDREGATAVFRIFQESLTNVARHAQATKVQVGLERVDGHLLLRLADNGRGIGDIATRGTHSFGILGMHERVRLLNGEMSISGDEGQGTVINVEIPLFKKPELV
jgi:signal transduction histidine kinase